jgi:hypothetical protein
MCRFNNSRHSETGRAASNAVKFFHSMPRCAFRLPSRRWIWPNIPFLKPNNWPPGFSALVNDFLTSTLAKFNRPRPGPGLIVLPCVQKDTILRISSELCIISPSQRSTALVILRVRRILDSTRLLGKYIELVVIFQTSPRPTYSGTSPNLTSSAPGQAVTTVGCCF